MVRKDHKLSVRRQCALLTLVWSNLFYDPEELGACIVIGFFMIFNSNWDKDEPQTLHYAIMIKCSKGADVRHYSRQPQAASGKPGAVQIGDLASIRNVA